MKVIVHDASILIDLALTKTVEAWFAVGIETWTTSLIFPNELGRFDQRALFESYASAGHLKIHQFEPTELQAVVDERLQLGRGLSLADVSALVLAKKFGPRSTLATGDKLLRSTAEKQKIKACGVLGLFDIMVEGTDTTPATLPFSVAAEKLKSFMLLPECRLPHDRCANKIKLWQQSRTR